MTFHQTNLMNHLFLHPFIAPIGQALIALGAFANSLRPSKHRTLKPFQFLLYAARGSWDGEVASIMRFYQTADQEKVIESGNLIKNFCLLLFEVTQDNYWLPQTPNIWLLTNYGCPKLDTQKPFQFFLYVVRGSWGGKVAPIMTFHQTNIMNHLCFHLFIAPKGQALIALGDFANQLRQSKLRTLKPFQFLLYVARGSWGGKVAPIMTFHQTARQGKVIESGNSLLDASEPIDTNQTMP